MIKYLLILSTILLLASCEKNHSESSDTTDATDSTQVDSNALISDVNWNDGDDIFYEEEEEPKKSHRSSKHRSGGGGGVSGNL